MLDLIEENIEIMGGKPVIKGTRVTVEAILRRLAEGLSVEDILKDYPYLTKQDIQAALLYAVKGAQSIATVAILYFLYSL